MAMRASFDVEPIETPGSLSEKRSAQLAKRASAATRKCIRGIRGEFLATAYVAADGRVLAAGVAPPDEKGETASDCISDALLELKVKRGRERQASKVSFSIP